MNNALLLKRKHVQGSIICVPTCIHVLNYAKVMLCVLHRTRSFAWTTVYQTWFKINYACSMCMWLL